MAYQLSISTQSPGSVEFSFASDQHNQPGDTDFAVTVSEYDEFSQLVGTTVEPVTGWRASTGDYSWVGFAAFTGLTSGEEDVAVAHKTGGQKPLATFSFLVE